MMDILSIGGGPKPHRIVTINLRVVVDADGCVIGAAVPAGDDWNYIASALCRVERETAQRFSEQQPWYIAPFIYAY